MYLKLVNLNAKIAKGNESDMKLFIKESKMSDSVKRVCTES